MQAHEPPKSYRPTLHHETTFTNISNHPTTLTDGLKEGNLTIEEKLIRKDSKKEVQKIMLTEETGWRKNFKGSLAKGRG